MVEMENMCQICLLKFGKENCRLYASHEVYYGCFVIFDWIKRFWMLYREEPFFSDIKQFKLDF